MTTTKGVIDLKEYAPHLLINRSQSMGAAVPGATGGAATASSTVGKDYEFVKIIQNLY